MLAEWLGLLQGTERSLDRHWVRTWECLIFEERTGTPFLRTDFKPKICFSKNQVFFPQNVILDINTYSQICTGKYICTDIALIYADIGIY